MVCTTLRKGYECVFMTKNGCQFNGGRCYPIVEQCEGCQKVVEYPTGKFCMSFPDPSAKWNNGICNMATHVKRNHIADNHKLNPLKASKRGH
ncbi:MAG: PxxKW family cysteine-rich protein [Thermodesulfobacteriota bacterium]